MVQTITAATLLLSASSALAAPIFDETLIARDPSFGSVMSKIGHGIENGVAGVANVVGSVAQGVNSASTIKSGYQSFRGKREPELEAEDLAARDPSFGSVMSKIGHGIENGVAGAANVVGSVAQGINTASTIKSGYQGLRGKREEFALDARDIEVIEELAARDPSFGSFIKGLGKDIGKVASTVAPIAGAAAKFIREEDLAARDPSFGSFIKGIGKDIGKVASTVAPIAGTVAKFIREDSEALTARDIELIEDLAARDPSFGSFIKGLGKDIGKVASTVAPIASVATKFIREEEDLAARDPSFGSFIKGIGKDIGKVASTVAPIAGTVAKFIREDSEGLTARDIELIEELAARDPSFGSFIKGLGKDIGKVASTVAPIASVATKFIREEEDLAVRDPSFGSFIKGIGKDIGKVASTVAPIAGTVAKFIREEPDFAAREFFELEELD